MPTIAEALQLALQHHQAGRLSEAEQIYWQILQVQPKQADALHLLGMVAHQVGQHVAGVELIQQAIAAAPHQANFYNSLGNVYMSLERYDAAANTFRQATQRQPNFFDAYNNQGLACCKLEQYDEAATCFRAALHWQPNYADALNNLGHALRMSGKVEEAIACHRQALLLAPELAEGHNNLGCALKELGDFSLAIDCYRRAIALKPTLAEAHNNLGIALARQGKLNEAVASYEQALAIQPKFEEVFYNLGILYTWQGRLDEAIANLRRAREFNSNDLSILSDLVHQLQHMCDWQELLPLVSQLLSACFSQLASQPLTEVSPFKLLTLPIPTTLQQQRDCAMQFASVWSHTAKPLLYARNPAPQPSGMRKMKLGFLSADYFAHPTAYLIADLIPRLDRKRFEVIGYSFSPQDGSDVRRRLEQDFDRFIDLIDRDYRTAAQQIANDEVDILIDLKGYTRDARMEILAFRPAPIQVNYLGYPGTMGADCIDYILVDDFIVPAEHQPYYTEKLVHLPGCYQVNDRQREIDERTPMRAECGLPETGFVFCSFNDNYKITPDMFDVWMQLLREIHGSVLWLYAGNQFAPDNLRREAAQRGMAPERLVFAERAPLPEHLARIRLADLFLDTFPVNAHTTASDALWAGCPLLTLTGETFISRVAGSLLRTIGLPELITTSLEEYHAKALHLARNPAVLAELRARLAANRFSSTLFNAEHFARKIEVAFTNMWSIHAAGEAPRAFRVTNEMLISDLR